MGTCRVRSIVISLVKPDMDSLGSVIRGRAWTQNSFRNAVPQKQRMAHKAINVVYLRERHSVMVTSGTGHDGSLYNLAMFRKYFIRKVLSIAVNPKMNMPNRMGQRATALFTSWYNAQLGSRRMRQKMQCCNLKEAPFGCEKFQASTAVSLPLPLSPPLSPSICGRANRESLIPKGHPVKTFAGDSSDPRVEVLAESVALGSRGPRVPHEVE